MLLDQFAARLNLTPAQLERESLRLYLEQRLRVVESELLDLARKYSLKSVEALDQAIRAGRFHEPETFEDYFRFDYLESTRDELRELLGQL